MEHPPLPASVVTVISGARPSHWAQSQPLAYSQGSQRVFGCVWRGKGGCLQEGAQLKGSGQENSAFIN